MPRLPGFYARYPNIQVHVHSRIGQFDLQLAGMDAVIGNSPDGQWPGAVAVKLLDEELVPVVSPAVAGRFPDRRPQNLEGQLLLQVAARPNVWREWFAAMGLSAKALRMGPTFELTSHLMQAVAADLGAGLVARFLVEEELDSGWLVEACEVEPLILLAYYLFVPTHRLEYPPVRAFRDWLLEVV